MHSEFAGATAFEDNLAGVARATAKRGNSVITDGEREVAVQKISVCGKGGSGKSTIVTLLASAMREKGYGVLVVDSDESNPGLYRLLGLESRPAPLLELIGGKKEVFPTFSQEAEPSPSVLTQEQIPIADIPGPYLAEGGGLKLVCIGKIVQSFEGCACPMGALSREFLKRLHLHSDEVAIVDMEAGIEHFGRGVEMSVDAVLIVVEPSLDSLELAGKIHRMAAESGVNSVWALLNKMASEEMTHSLRQDLQARGITVVGSIAYHPDISRSGLEGRPPGGSGAESAMASVVDRLLEGGGPCA